MVQKVRLPRRLENAEPDELGQSASGSGHYLCRSLCATARFSLHPSVKTSSRRARTHVRDSLQRNKASMVIGADFGSAVLADAFFFDRVLSKIVLPLKKVGDAFFPKTQPNELFTHMHVTRCICTHVSRRPEDRIDPFYSRFAQKRRSRDLNHSIEFFYLELFRLRLQLLHHFPPGSRFVLQNSNQQFFQFSDESSVFAASCSVAKNLPRNQ